MNTIVMQYNGKITFNAPESKLGDLEKRNELATH